MLALHVTTLCCRRENLDVNDKIFQTLLKTLKSRFLELFGHMQKLRYFKESFTEGKLGLRKSFTLRQTPHMSLPTPQVPPPCTDVPHPDPPVFLHSTVSQFCFSVSSLWGFYGLPAGGCGITTPGFWQVGVPQPMPR